MRTLLIISTILFSLSACRTIRPAAPSIANTPIPAVPQPQSDIDIPITAELKTYFQQADGAIPTQLNGGDNPCQGLRYSYHFERTPLAIAGTGNTISLHVTGSYWVSGNYCAKCVWNRCVVPQPGFSCGTNGEPMRQVAIGYSSTFSVQPNYHLQSATGLTQLDAINQCIVTVAHINVTDKLLGAVRGPLQNLAAQVDQKIAGVNLQPQVQQFWDKMNEEIPLGELGYLHIFPKALRLSSLNLNGSLLNFSVGLSANPLITSTSQNVPVTPLPNLSNYTPGNGFNIYLDLDARYDSLSAILDKAVVGKQVPIGKKRVTFVKARIYGIGNSKLVVELQFKGSAKGTLYLIGTPAYDGVSHLLSMPDLSFDVNTSNVLLKLAKWLFDTRITDALKSYARYDLTPLVQEGKTKLNAAMNRNIGNSIMMAGNANDINFQGIYPTTAILILRGLANGQLNLTIN